MDRTANLSRKSKETDISLILNLDGSGRADIRTGIPFFDHMLTAFCVHGFFDLMIRASGDLEVDFHHTVEDVGLVLGQAIAESLGNRHHIVRFGDSAVPMDEALSTVTIDLSNRPYLVFRHPEDLRARDRFSMDLAREFFQAVSVRGAFNLHINTCYGSNEHHVLESVFKAFGRSLHMASRVNTAIQGPLSTKGKF